MIRRYRPLLLSLGVLFAVYMWSRSSTPSFGRVTTRLHTAQGNQDLLLGVQPNPSSLRRNDPLHRLSEMDFRLTAEDWEMARKPLDVTKEFKDLGQRLRLFFEKWRKWESLHRWLSVEGVVRMEGTGIGSTVVDEYRNVRSGPVALADDF